MLAIYSENYCMCDIGRKTGEVDMHGQELFTGDIVQLWHGNYIGTDREEWMPSDGLTAIVANQYISYSDGVVKLLDKNAKPFTMGISAVGISDREWHVSLVKSHSEVVEGERFKAYGFNYRAKPQV